MKRRLVLAAGMLVFAATACNAVLGNELGHLETAANDAATDGNTGLDAAVPTDASNDGSIPRDAGGDALVDQSAPWEPAQLGSALAIWLDGDRGISTTICNGQRCAAIWADQSGNGNDARPPNVGAAPVVRAAAYNGHGALAFDGTTTSLAIDDSLSSEVTGGFAVFGVAAAATNAAHPQGDIYSKTAPGIPFAGPALWVNYANTGVAGSDGRGAAQVDFYQFIPSAEMHLDDGALRVYSATFDGGNLSMRVNDGAPSTVSTTVTPGALRALGASSSVGGRLGTQQLLLGDIAEVILVNRTITPAEWTSAFHYLKTKYALH